MSVVLQQQPDFSQASAEASPFVPVEAASATGVWRRVDGACVVDGTALNGAWRVSDAGFSANDVEMSASSAVTIFEPCGTGSVISTVHLQRVPSPGSG